MWTASEVQGLQVQSFVWTSLKVLMALALMELAIRRRWPQTKISFGSAYTRMILRGAANVGLKLLRSMVA